MKSMLANAKVLEPLTDKPEYKSRFKALQTRLHELQRACWKEGLPTIVVFEGWDTAGRAAIINKLTERLEPRGFQLHTVREPRSFELQLPWMWRFWKCIPAYGEIAIFDYSWYRQVFVDRVDRGERPAVWKRRCKHVVGFERALTDDGTRLVKIFLHIS
ncbi:MAG: phosphate--AMP phosphotransferase, partial [Acidobacteria bacterium]|nr:phosphate--AMP phosphotransferase [Acidobacteriota bacterium]